MILGAFLAVVAGLAGLSILGRDLGKTPIDARPSLEASEAAVASVAPSVAPSVDPTHVASSEPTPEEVVPEPTPEPPPTPPPAPHGGVPTTTRTASVALAEPSTFVATGIENISPEGGGFWRAVAGFDGAVWGFTSGRVSRIDPRTGERRTWTTADDARFSAWAIFPARSGGVWIANRDGVRRFDGTRFREGYLLPDTINVGIEAPDRTLWLVLSDQSLLHVAGSTETRIDTLIPGQDVGISAIEIDRAGGIWCSWSRWGDFGGNGQGWYTRYDGRSWSVVDTYGIPGLTTPNVGLAAAPDGSVWTLTNDTIGRYARGAWTTWPFPEGLQSVQGISAGPTGTIWVAGDHLARWDGSSWLVRPFPFTEGSPWGAGPWVVATPSGVVASDGAGVFRVTATAMEAIIRPTDAQPVYGQIALAASRSEVWVADGDRLWRWADGTWTPTEASAIGPTTALVRMPSGRFAGLNQGESVLVSDETRDGTATWRFLSTDPATALTVATDGRLWVVHRESGRAFTVRSYGEDGGTWTEISRTPPTDLIAQPTSVTIAPDGTIWLGSGGEQNQFGTGLVRYVRGRWESVHPRGSAIPVVVNEVAIAGDGSTWVAGRDGSDGSGGPWIARWDGDRWTDPFDGAAPEGDPHVAAGPDGSIWATNGVGLVRFDGVRRTTYATGLGIWQIRVAGDGGVWLQAEGGVARLVSTGDPAVSR